MSVFILETDAASSAASSISSLSTEVANIGSSVSGYDTSCEDGFNFAGAKSVIAGNLEACSVKISNTAKVIESVVSQHTALQNQLKFQDPSQAQNGTNTNGTNTSGTNTGGTDTSGTNTSGTNTSGNYTGGNDNSGGYYPSGGGGYDDGGYDGGGDVTIPEPTPTEEVQVDKKGEVKAKLDKIGYAYADEENLSDETKKLLRDQQFNYDENGYAMIGSRYVITCDSSIANVGDVLRFQQKDGNVVDCVVGVTTVSEKYKNAINFIVDKNATGVKVTDVTKNLLADNTKITNVGSLTDVRRDDLVQLLQESSGTNTTVAATGNTESITNATGATATPASGIEVATAVKGTTTSATATPASGVEVATAADGTTTIVTAANSENNSNYTVQV